MCLYNVCGNSRLLTNYRNEVIIEQIHINLFSKRYGWLSGAKLSVYG